MSMSRLSIDSPLSQGVYGMNFAIDGDPTMPELKWEYGDLGAAKPNRQPMCQVSRKGRCQVPHNTRFWKYIEL